MGKIGGYIALFIIAAVGLYTVSQLNTVSDVIAESNRQMKEDRKKGQIMAEEMEQERYLSEGNAVVDAPESSDWAEDETAE